MPKYNTPPQSFPYDEILQKHKESKSRTPQTHFFTTHRDQIIDLLQKGVSKKLIAEVCGVSYVSLCAWLRSEGFSSGKRTQKARSG